MNSQSSVRVEGGVQAMDHLLLVCEEKAFCQLGAPSPPMGVQPTAQVIQSPLGLRKSPHEGFPDNTFPHIPGYQGAILC